MPHIKQLLYGDEKLEWSEWSRYFKRKLVDALFSEYSQRFPNSNARPSRADAVALRKELASQFPNKFGLGQIWNEKLYRNAYDSNKNGVKDGLRSSKRRWPNDIRRACGKIRQINISKNKVCGCRNQHDRI